MRKLKYLKYIYITIGELMKLSEKLNKVFSDI